MKASAVGRRAGWTQVDVSMHLLHPGCLLACLKFDHNQSQGKMMQGQAGVCLSTYHHRFGQIVKHK